MSTYPDDPDGEVLARLAERGIDMSQPLLIEFAIAAPDEMAAQAIDTTLIEQGYQSHVEFDEGEPDEDGEYDEDEPEFAPLWTVFVEIEMVPDYAAIMRIQSELDKVAQIHGGHSDGWGVLLDADESDED